MKSHTLLTCALLGASLHAQSVPSPEPANNPTPIPLSAPTTPESTEAKLDSAPIESTEPKGEPAKPAEASVAPLDSVPELPASKLDYPCLNYRVEDEDIANALQLLGRTYGITIIVEPDVKGKTTFTLPRGTVREVIDSIVSPGGFHYEEKNNIVTVRRMYRKIYRIEYLQQLRSSSETSSVSLSGGSSSGNSSYNGGGHGGGFQQNQQNFSANGQGGMGGGGQGLNDQTAFQITTKNDGDLWSSVNQSLKAIISAEETFNVDPTSGMVFVRASKATHEVVTDYINMMNDIINQQVYVNADIIEVNFTDEEKLGIDWTQLSTDVGHGILIGGASKTNLLDVGTAPLSPDTFNATFKIGKLSGLLNALAKQGKVSTKSSPRLATMNNVTAYQTVGIESGFFSTNTSFNPVLNPNGTNGGTNVIDTYSERRFTFGVVFKVTPLVHNDGSITLDLLPAITKLNGVDRSPDNKQSSPRIDTKRTSSMINLREGEAAIIGGLIIESEGDTTQKVPVLGSIPGLGRAFRHEAKVKSRSEIIIIVTAHKGLPKVKNDAGVATPVKTASAN